jgi:glycosyltransferase involved in cell wall biosynthesis
VELSVVLPTRNRADLLRQVLESYMRQSLPPSEYELVVVDDGSDDETPDVCRALRSKLSLAYIPIAPSGLPAAKNAGIAASSGRLILFADDDDVAAPELLRSHLAAHAEHPEPNVAILGYTAWHPDMAMTPLMHYVTNVGQFLFSYARLRHGQELDFRYFWGGRTSATRSLLTRDGGFDERLAPLDDIEFGYRLSQAGLRVVFDRRAERFMIRRINYAEFCARCERVGAALARLRKLHRAEEIEQYVNVLVLDRAKLLDSEEIAVAIEAARSSLDRLSPQVQDLERRVTGESRPHRRVPAVAWALSAGARRRLYGLYSEAFRLSMLKGSLTRMMEPLEPAATPQDS